MLIDRRCPHCGATMQFEDTMESMFCPFCGGMVSNDAFDRQDSTNINEPNLYISYNSTDKNVGMVTRIVSTGVKNTYISGQTLSFHLTPGTQNIVLKIGRINYNRSVVIPSDNSPVRIYASYDGRAHISIDQPQASSKTNNSYGTASVNSNANNTSSSQANLTWKQYLWAIIGFFIFVAMIRSCFFGGSSGSSSSPSSSEVTTTTTVRTYEVTLNVECEENLLFSKYDVIVEFDDQEIGEIDHGKTKTLTGSLTEGKHTITFHESGYKSVDGSREIDVSGPISINCKIHCTGSQVEIKEFDVSAVAADPLSGKPIANRQQRKGFDSSTNKTISVADFICEIPDYWNEDDTQKVISDSFYKHVSKAESDDAFVRLLYAVTEDNDNSMFKAIMDNKESYAKAVAEGLGASKYTLIRQEISNYGEVKGLFSVMDATLEKNGLENSATIYSFIFPSTQKYVQFGIIVSDNAKYVYTDDVIAILNSIKKNNGSYTETTVDASESTSVSSSESSTSETVLPTPSPTLAPTPSPTPTPTPAPTPTPEPVTESSTRFAYSSERSDYTIYYIIDTKAKKVYYFTSIDRKAYVGTIKSGNLSSGITVKYPDGTEKISYSGDESRIVVYDSFGNDWYFDICNLKEAEKIMKK